MTPIIQLQSKVVRFQKKKLGDPKDFTDRIGFLAEMVFNLNLQPRIQQHEPNTDSLARIFNAVLDLAQHMKVSGEDLIRLGDQRLEIDLLQQKHKETLGK